MVPDGAETRTGLFTTHRVGDDLLFEIADSLIGVEVLVVPRLARAPQTASGPYGGQQVNQARVVRWERQGERLLLREVRYGLVADDDEPIALAVDASNLGPVLAAFDVRATTPDSAGVVIDVTRLFTSPPPELSPGSALPGNPDASRSFVERVAAYPINVEVEALLTAPPPPGRPAGSQAVTTSVVMHWSWVLLPAEPMMPRLWDSRVGFYPHSRVDYGRPAQGSEVRTYITRYRLEKQDPSAALSEPVKPITYYVDPATPAWLVPWVKRGVEAWQPAFEEAGFLRGIVALDAPTPEEDPDWSPEDARYSVVRWLPSTIENAQGPHVADPRTGEILEADIYMYHNVMTLLRTWYFSHVGHLDARALEWPYPDELMGRLVEYVVAHEVGHTLGFNHNQKASSTYPVDSLRSRAWVEEMGFTPTLMDYSRFNYVAQPEDSLPIETLIPGIGPYDRWATRWGYAPVPGAASPDAERPTLDRWAREQDSVPWYRWNMPDSRGADPGDHTNAVGDQDPVRATGWGMRSLHQIAPLLRTAAERERESYDDLELLYTRLVGFWGTQLNHVTNVVGGADAQEKYVGQEGARYRPWPGARQREALAFLHEHAFQRPDFLLDDAVLRRVEVEGAIRRINGVQAGVLGNLLNDRRLERMIEFDAIDGGEDPYPLAEMLADLRRGLWSELGGGRVEVDAFRRELQRSYLSLAEAKIHPTPPDLPTNVPASFLALVGPARATSDVRALFRHELRELDREVARALPRAASPTTRAHLQHVRDEIRRVLDETR